MTFRIHRGGSARTVNRREARRKVQCETHGLVLSVQGDRTVKEVAAAAVTCTQVMSWWNDLRRGHLPVYGALLRFIDVSVAVGTPKWVLKKIPRVIDWYIEEQYDPTTTGEIKLVTFDDSKPLAA